MHCHWKSSTRQPTCRVSKNKQECIAASYESYTQWTWFSQQPSLLCNTSIRFKPNSFQLLSFTRSEPKSYKFLSFIIFLIIVIRQTQTLFLLLLTVKPAQLLTTTLKTQIHLHTAIYSKECNIMQRERFLPVPNYPLKETARKPLLFLLSPPNKC